MEHSEQINELASALAKAQGEIGGAIKDSANPHFRSKFASLASVREAFRDALAKHGLSVVQMPERTADEVAVVTQLLHSSGQWIRCRTSAVPVKHDPQGVGSAISYLRRYSLMAVIGIAPDEELNVVEDDDGEAAAGRDPKPRAKRHEPKSDASKNAEPTPDAGLVEWKKKIDACKTVPELKALQDPIKQLPDAMQLPLREHWKACKKAIEARVTEELQQGDAAREPGMEG